MAKKLIYEGFFIIGALGTKHDACITYKHITSAFKPAEAHKHLYGTEVVIRITGRGCNERVEALSVKLESCDNKELADIFANIPKPHITIATFGNGKPVEANELSFSPLKEERLVTAVFGGFYSEDWGGTFVDVRNGIISNNAKYEVSIDSASGSTKPYVDKLRSNGFKVTMVDLWCDSEPIYAVEINSLDDLYKLINIVGHDVVINKSSDGCHEPHSITIYDYYLE